MTVNNSIKIIATGKYLPQRVDSTSLEKKLSIPTGWAVKNSGVAYRHHVTFESAGYMGARAIESALKKAGMDLSEIDLIISASATFDYPLPNQSSVIKNELKDGLNYNIGTLDIDTTCLSFVSAFEIAAKLLDGKQYKNIVLVSAEISSKGIDASNWETATLFGDAAVAVIVQYDASQKSHLIKAGLRTYSLGLKSTIIQGGGNQFHIKDFPYDIKLHTFQMEGIKLLKMAKKNIPDFMDWFFEELPLSLEDIDSIIPHQASRTGLAVLKSLYSFKQNQIKENISQYGNCIAASIPLVLHDTIENGELKRGDTCFLSGTSAGFSIGGVLIVY